MNVNSPWLSSFRFWLHSQFQSDPFAIAQFDHVRQTFTALPDVQKWELVSLRHEGVLPSDRFANLGMLEQTGFVDRDWATGNLSVRPGLRKDLERVVGEWEKGKAT